MPARLGWAFERHFQRWRARRRARNRPKRDWVAKRNRRGNTRNVPHLVGSRAPRRGPGIKKLYSVSSVLRIPFPGRPDRPGRPPWYAGRHVSRLKRARFPNLSFALGEVRVPRVLDTGGFRAAGGPCVGTPMAPPRSKWEWHGRCDVDRASGLRARAPPLGEPGWPGVLQ